MNLIETDTNVRDAMRCYILTAYTHHDFTPHLCKYLREFQKYSLDGYSEITILLPNLKTLIFNTTNRSGARLTLEIRTWSNGPPSEFQKKRWWQIFRVRKYAHA